MNCSNATLFCKRVTCPSAETLLSYHVDGLTSMQRAWITQHLFACDFCGAELQLLIEHSPTETEAFTLTDIPLNLRRLAESLLNGGALGIERLSDPVYEKDSLTLTDA